jgi:hypothetical protein
VKKGKIILLKRKENRDNIRKLETGDKNTGENNEM